MLATLDGPRNEALRWSSRNLSMYGWNRRKRGGSRGLEKGVQSSRTSKVSQWMQHSNWVTGRVRISWVMCHFKEHVASAISRGHAPVRTTVQSNAENAGQKSYHQGLLNWLELHTVQRKEGCRTSVPCKRYQVLGVPCFYMVENVFWSKHSRNYLRILGPHKL